MSGGPVLVVDDDMVSRHVLGQALANAKLDFVAVGVWIERLRFKSVGPQLVVDVDHPGIANIRYVFLEGPAED